MNEARHQTALSWAMTLAGERVGQRSQHTRLEGDSSDPEVSKPPLRPRDPLPRARMPKQPPPRAERENYEQLARSTRKHDPELPDDLRKVRAHRRRADNEARPSNQDGAGQQRGG